MIDSNSFTSTKVNSPSIASSKTFVNMKKKRNLGTIKSTAQNSILSMLKSKNYDDSLEGLASEANNVKLLCTKI